LDAPKREIIDLAVDFDGVVVWNGVAVCNSSKAT
jgi:hypothetical protein